MAYTPQSPFPKSRGDTMRSGDWNDAVNEVLRLETAKVNRAGDAVAGSLTIDGGNANSGGKDPWLNFGATNSGEGISSPRTGQAPNRFGLDLFTASQPRLTIDNSGRVGIGIRGPQAALDVQNGDVRWAKSRLTADQGGSIELGGDNATAGGGAPYIDFHYGGAAQDFNARLQNDANGQLSVFASRFYVHGAMTVEPGELSIRAMPPNDSTPMLTQLALRTRAAGGGERSWSLYTAAVGGGFGVEANAFEIWQYPDTVPRLRIRPNGDTVLTPSGGTVIVPGDLAWGAGGARLVNNQGGSIELGSATGPGSGTPFIDFHFGGIAQDFNTRIINDGNGQLTLVGNVNITGNLGTHGQSYVPRTAGWGGGVHTWDLEAEGSIWCPHKNFRIDHPLDPENQFLVHGCLEGPESGVYYRGTAELVDGEAEVELPDYFEALTREEGRTVLLTPVAEGDGPVSVLAASGVRGGRFRVRAIDAANPAQRFCWAVTADRADAEPLEVEVAKLVAVGAAGEEGA